MPIYDYKCSDCQHLFSVMVAMKDKDKVKCEKCGSSDLKQLFTGFNFFKAATDNCGPAGSRFT